MSCSRCRSDVQVVSALVDGTYYSAICRNCIAGLSSNNGLSSGASGYERRRQYEDYADETVQPYNAAGPNTEFYRLYPEQAEKIFTKDEIEEIRRQI